MDMILYTNKAHKFNAAMMWTFSIILSFTAYIKGGISLGIAAGTVTGITSLIATFLAFLKVKSNLIKSIILPLLPTFGILVYSIAQGGVERMFTGYLVCTCLAAVYFNRKVLAIFASIISTMLITVFFINPKIILGNTTDISEFIPRFGLYICGSLALYYLSSEGNKHLTSANNENKKAQLLNESLTNVIKQVNETTENLFENVNRCKDSILENQQGITNIAKSIDDISRAAEDSAVAVNNVSDYVTDSTNIINDTYSLSKEVEKEFRSTYDTLSLGSKEADNMMNHMDVMRNSIQSAVQAVSELQKKMDLIGEFLISITDIASQTNMLALNASIEAARAGESGRGFTVVAEEIRRLAEQSSKTAKDIQYITMEAQNTTCNAIEEVQKGSASVEEGTAMITEFMEIFCTIKNSIDSVNNKLYAEYEMMDKIADRFNNMREQLETLAATSEENSASTQQILSMTTVQDEAIKSTAQMVKEISNLGQKLKDQING